MKEKISLAFQIIVLAVLFACLMYIFELSTVYGAQNLTYTRDKKGDELQMTSTTTVKEVVVTTNKTYQEDKILACLLYLESTNRHDIVILDSNNQYSIGGYQFQVATVRDILARYEHTAVTEVQAVKIAKDPLQSKELARRAIFEYKLSYKWKNSFIKMRNGECKEVTSEDLKVINRPAITVTKK